MRKFFVSLICLQLVGWFGENPLSALRPAAAGVLLAAEQQDEDKPPRKNAKHIYYTYEVVAVSDTSFTIERHTKGGELVRVTIARKRRPDIKVGDRVRYDKKRNRLGRTLPPEEKNQ